MSNEVKVFSELFNAIPLDQAACAGENTEVFFPDVSDRAGVLAAKKICAGCGIAAQCLLWAIANNEAGIWGGTTPDERRRLKSPTLRKSVLVKLERNTK